MKCAQKLSRVHPYTDVQNSALYCTLGFTLSGSPAFNTKKETTRDLLVYSHVRGDIDRGSKSDLVELIRFASITQHFDRGSVYNSAVDSVYVAVAGTRTLIESSFQPRTLHLDDVH